VEGLETRLLRSVSRHLVLLLLKSTFLIERNVLITAVQNGLITPQSLTNPNERLNNPQTDFLPLLFRIDCDIFDMSHLAQSTKEFLLDEESADAYYFVCGSIEDDEGEIGVWTGFEGGEVGLVGF